MIEIAGLPVSVVRHARSKRLKLALDPRRRALRLTLPPRASVDRALAWAREQAPWVVAQAARLPETAPPLAPGGTVEFEGGTLEIVHDPARRRGVVRDGDRLLVGGTPDLAGAAVLRWLKGEALRLFSADTFEIAERAAVRVERVSIGDPRTRWGSCTGGGAIRYNWRLVMAPAWVRRATVAHEVAHRVHMDHSPRFHALVAAIADDPLHPGASRRWLAAHGTRLHGVSASRS